ncbi:hypothetical protein CALCODRAFT_37510 [Calocera cornea HHB12733]|uniref:Secreted protein n=1 Tax=Calocera cornea HHB12733 TaxID=1353952 RepID=A0A165DXU6_9BASI|nr:hypothetical protein CALCODRAFT_37510 [Calocera cornea HHB12733]
MSPSWNLTHGLWAGWCARAAGCGAAGSATMSRTVLSLPLYGPGLYSSAAPMNRRNVGTVKRDVDSDSAVYYLRVVCRLGGAAPPWTRTRVLSITFFGCRN